MSTFHFLSFEVVKLPKIRILVRRSMHDQFLTPKEGASEFATSENRIKSELSVATSESSEFTVSFFPYCIFTVPLLSDRPYLYRNKKF